MANLTTTYFQQLSLIIFAIATTQQNHSSPQQDINITGSTYVAALHSSNFHLHFDTNSIITFAIATTQQNHSSPQQDKNIKGPTYVVARSCAQPKNRTYP